MELVDLIARLPKRSLEPVLEADPQAPVYTISFRTNTQREPRSDVLYFADVTMLPASVGPERFFNCVLIGATGEEDAVRALAPGRNCNVFRVAAGHDPFALYNRLQDFFIEDAGTSAQVRRMLDALTANRGLSYLVEEASAALGNPVVVVDPGFRYIAQHGIDLESDDTAFGDVMREEMSFHSVLEDGVSYIRASDIDRRIARARRPVLVENEHLGQTTLVGAAVVRGVWLAHVMLIARNRPFSPTDPDVFARLVELVGQELQKGELFSEGSHQMQAAFLSGVLSEGRPSQAVVARRLEVLGITLRPALYLAVLRRRDRVPFEGVAETTVVEQLGPVLSHGLAAAFEGEVVVLMSRTDAAGLDERSERALEAVAQANELLAGVSNEFSDLCDARRHLLQARSAIDYGSRFTKVLDDTGLYRYCDYTYMEMLALSNDHVNLMNYCHPAILALLDYDRTHGTELLETLFAYMQNTANTARTARLLSLHKNTLLYRIGRIREIMHNDLQSGEDLFLFHLSIRSLLYLGLFEPRTKPRTQADLHAGTEA